MTKVQSTAIQRMCETLDLDPAVYDDDWTALLLLATARVNRLQSELDHLVIDPIVKAKLQEHRNAIESRLTNAAH